MKGTIARVRSASSWILHPTWLIDRLLDQLDKLSVVLALPAQNAGLVRSPAPIATRPADLAPFNEDLWLNLSAVRRV